MTDQREDFEEAAARMGYSLTMAEHETGEYRDSATQDSWDMWQECCDKAACESEGGEAVRLSESRAGWVYLAGPMTGMSEYNYPAFNRAATELAHRGMQVINPADHGIVDGAIWGDYLRYDISGLACCEKIALLPGWENSKGARLEKYIADELGMEVIFLDGASAPQPDKWIPEGWKVLRMPELQKAIGSGPVISLAGPKHEALTFISDADERRERDTYAFLDALLSACPTAEKVPDETLKRLDHLLEGIENIRRNAGGDAYLWGYTNAMHKELSEVINGLTRPTPPEQESE